MIVDPKKELKMWLFVRGDLTMPAGKLAVQAGHAFCACLWRSSLIASGSDLVAYYMVGSYAKIAVRVADEAELHKTVEACVKEGLVSVAIRDEGRTIFPEPTYTVGAVGPTYREALPSSVRRLRLL